MVTLARTLQNGYLRDQKLLKVALICLRIEVEFWPVKHV